MEQPGHTAPAHDPALQHQPERLAGSMSHQARSRGSKGHLLQEACVVEPAGQALDTTRGLLALRDLQRDVGQRRALPTHEPTEECRERHQVPDDSPWRLARIPWREGVSYGTRPAEVVTHGMLLLDGSLLPERIQ